jgi:hypothetical protein
VHPHPGRRNGRHAQTKEQREATELIDDVANTFTRKGLREDEMTMEDWTFPALQMIGPIPGTVISPLRGL